VGLLQAKSIKPSLIMLDSVLPDMDGFELCRQLKIDVETKNIPVIMMSNFDDADDFQRAINLGAVDYIIKFNILPEVLIDRIKEIMSGSFELLPHSRTGKLKELDEHKGAMLLNSGIINIQQLREALKKVNLKGITLLQALIEIDALSDNLKYQIMELFYGADYVNLSEYVLDMNAVNLITSDLARHFFVIPMRFDGDKLLVALSDPMDVEIEEHLRKQLKRPIKMVYAPPDDIEKAIAIYYGSSLHMEEIDAEITRDKIKGKYKEEDDSDLYESDSHVGKLVDSLILQAIAMRGSDIHFEPKRNSMLVRYRIDGILHDMQTLPKEIIPSVTSRIKILSNLDIAERRKPQDGRIEKKTGDRSIDIRVSIVPVVFGEKVVLRILDKSVALYSIMELGLTSSDEKKFTSLLKQHGGMMLVTGPTGSGKTTTLYAALNYLKSSELNIISLEDPVEFVIDGVNQIAINPKVGLTFATALRSVLRQDPNIVMIGEIRDLETAELAIQAALTGHFVIGTLHTRNAPGAITRLIDMGVHPYLVASTLVGVIAQRLVRKSCHNCAKDYRLSPDENLSDTAREFLGMALKKSAGCELCHYKGYLGRIGVFEIMSISEQMRKLIISEADISELTEVARKEGMLTLKDEAIIRVKEGMTTVDELLRVIV
jgi:type IV pilus assembly protein PilB